MFTTPLKQSQGHPHLQQQKRRKPNRGNKAALQTPLIHITIRLNVNRTTILLQDLTNPPGNPRMPSKSPGQAPALHHKRKERSHILSKLPHKVSTKTPTQRLKIIKFGDHPGIRIKTSRADQMVSMHMKGDPL